MSAPDAAALVALTWTANDTSGAEVGHPDRTTVEENDPECEAWGDHFCTANTRHKGPHVAGSHGHGVVAVWEQGESDV